MENENNEVNTNNLEGVIDTDISGGTLEFIKGNAAGLGLLALAGYGAYEGTKRAIGFVRKKVTACKEKIQEKKATKEEKKEDIKEKKS